MQETYQKASTASSHNLDRAALSLAEISLMNGSASEDQKEAALHLAQRAGVTTSEYLRALIFVETSIASEAIISFERDGDGC